MFALSFESWISVIQKIVENEDPLCGILFLHIKSCIHDLGEKKRTLSCFDTKFIKTRIQVIHIYDGRTNAFNRNKLTANWNMCSGRMFNSFGWSKSFPSYKTNTARLHYSFTPNPAKTTLTKQKIQLGKRKKQIEILGKEYQQTPY